MKIKCRNCSYVNHYHCCEICKSWYYNENKTLKYLICSKCYKESEKIYLDLMNCSEFLNKEKNIEQIKKEFPKLSKKYSSLLIDFDGF